MLPFIPRTDSFFTSPLSLKSNYDEDTIKPFITRSLKKTLCLLGLIVMLSLIVTPILAIAGVPGAGIGFAIMFAAAVVALIALAAIAIIKNKVPWEINFFSRRRMTTPENFFGQVRQMVNVEVERLGV
jgi:hypothetical protein